MTVLVSLLLTCAGQAEGPTPPALVFFVMAMCLLHVCVYMYVCIQTSSSFLKHKRLLRISRVQSGWKWDDQPAAQDSNNPVLMQASQAVLVYVYYCPPRHYTKCKEGLDHTC